MARYGLRSYVNRTPSLTCMAELRDAGELEIYLSSHTAPDIIFMDINMPGISGLDFIATHTTDSAIVIVTAYEQYALIGLELNVCDYLLKPVSFTRFMQAVEKASQYVGYRKGSTSAEVIYVRADRALRRLPLSDILFLESIGNYVRLHTLQERIVARSTMKDLLAALPVAGFVRIHKSFVINLRHIARIATDAVTMSDSTRLPISRTYRNALKHAGCKQ